MELRIMKVKGTLSMDFYKTVAFVHNVTLLFSVKGGVVYVYPDKITRFISNSWYSDEDIKNL